MRVFLTGVDGFVGSNIARTMLSKGAVVSGLLHHQTQNEKSGLKAWGITSQIQTYVGDVADSVSLASAFKDSNPQWIFHLAAQAIVCRAESNVQETVRTNVQGTCNVIDLASTLDNLSGIIIASSDKAYGHSSFLPYKEETPLRGGGIYDTSKACADLLAHSLAKATGLPLGITRCANIYGPGDLNLSRIIPDIITSLIQSRPPVIRNTGRQKRDFIYIEDAISAYLKLAEYIAEHNLCGEAFNFGTGIPIEMLDLVNYIIQIMDSDAKEAIVLGHHNSYEIEEQYVDASKARSLIGWEPQVSLLNGLKRTIKWYERYFSENKHE